MNKIASLSQEERMALFQESANSRGIQPQIIEKDFWVCWTLNKLFELPEVGPHLMFKGGTSLSKVYDVIDRFSEDIDISINREYFGFAGELDPLSIIGSNKRKAAVEDLIESCKAKVKGSLLDDLSEAFSASIGGEDWNLAVDNFDEQSLLFEFPQSIETTNTDTLRYVKPIIRIEFGARAEHHPSEIHEIRSYAAEDFPGLFSEPTCKIKVLAAERTFWEKATILHDQFHRSETDSTAERSSRHYYDLYKLASTEIAVRAKADIDLLSSVVENKITFFPRAASKYTEALEGKLHLSPNPTRLKALRSDYQQMDEMFFSDPLDLDQILDSLAQLEIELNQLVVTSKSHAKSG